MLKYLIDCTNVMVRKVNTPPYILYYVDDEYYYYSDEYVKEAFEFDLYNL